MSLLDTPNPPLRSSQRGSTPRIDVSKVPSAGNATRPQSSYRTTAPSDHSNGPSGRPRSLSARAPKLAVGVSTTPQRSVSHKHTHKRNSSLPQRFPGDMSHRPLDMIKRETKVANRAGKHRRGPSQPDIIDALDTVGGGYHHDGPYEATLASRNIHSKYSPLEAVRDSNMEAIRATPHEYIQDSLTRHVPLQGTSTIPNGSVDLKGNVLTYQEGADLMREKDAPGGAYGRWDGTVSSLARSSPHRANPPRPTTQMISRARESPGSRMSVTTRERCGSVSSTPTNSPTISSCNPAAHPTIAASATARTMPHPRDSAHAPATACNVATQRAGA